MNETVFQAAEILNFLSESTSNEYDVDELRAASAVVHLLNGAVLTEEQNANIIVWLSNLVDVHLPPKE